MPSELCLLGLDVTALFPSMTARRTGEIVRRRVMASKIDPKGFDWKLGATYIVVNRHLTSQIGDLWKVLPYRRKVQGREPGMTGEAMTSRKGRVEDQWVFKTEHISKDQLMEIVGRVAEIATRVVFGNFTYNFGGKIYLQLEGGPIGARLTMACARLVMQDWGEKYQNILEESGILTTLFKIYVDDVRQVSTVLPLGMRFRVETGKIEYCEKAEEEDKSKQLEGESSSARMARILGPAMDSINPDLVFTTELAEDFKDERLPTLDFKMWLEEDLSINHT